MTIKVKESEFVSWIIIDREDKANSLDYEHLLSLKKNLSKVCDPSKNPRVVAITGSGTRYFSAGIDLVEVSSINDVDESIKLIIDGIGGLINSILLCSKPVVAAVNGEAYGLSVEILQVSDLVYAVRNSRISVPALRWSLVPPVTSLLLLDKRFVELVITGKVLDAVEAKSMGLINDIANDIEELRKKIEEVARSISRMDARMISLIKETRHSILWPTIHKGLLLMSLSADRGETKRRISEGFLKKH